MAIPGALYLAGVFLAAAGLLGLHHRRRIDRGRDYRIGIALLLLVTIAFDMLGERTVRDELTASKAARLVSGRKDVSVRCIGWFSMDRLVNSSAEGWVQFDADGHASKLATVDSGQCRTFRTFVSGGKVDVKTATAVVIVVHESVHLSGVTDEADTQCRAMAAIPKVLTSFGRDAGVAVEVVNAYMQNVYPYMPDAYRRPDQCRPELAAAGLKLVLGRAGSERD